MKKKTRNRQVLLNATLSTLLFASVSGASDAPPSASFPEEPAAENAPASLGTVEGGSPVEPIQQEPEAPEVSETSRPPSSSDSSAAPPEESGSNPAARDNQAPQAAPNDGGVSPLASAPALAVKPVRGEEPPSGIGQIIVGYVASGVGAANLASMPLCFSETYSDQDAEGVCVAVTTGLAAIGFGLGIPMLIVGYDRRARHDVWESGVATHLQRTGLRSTAGGGIATYSLEF